MCTTAERVVEVVASQFGVDNKKITRETRLACDLGADSLDVVEFIMELEEEFDIDIPEDAMSALGGDSVSENIAYGRRAADIKSDSVGSIIDYVERVLAET